MSDETTSATPLLRNINFWLFVVNRSSNVIGIHSLTVAVGWYVYKLTGDPLDLGLIGLAQFAPALILFLVAGLEKKGYRRESNSMNAKSCQGFMKGSLQVGQSYY